MSSPQRHRDTEKTKDRGLRRSGAASSRSSATEITESTEGAFAGTIELRDSLDSSPRLRWLKNTGPDGRLPERHRGTEKILRNAAISLPGAQSREHPPALPLCAPQPHLGALALTVRRPQTARKHFSACLCVSPVTSHPVLCSQSALFGKGSPISPNESRGLILEENAPSVLSLPSVAELREDAAPDLRNPLSLVFSVTLCLCGELIARLCSELIDPVLVMSPKESRGLILEENAPSVLSLPSVAEHREDAAPDLRKTLSLVFSVSLCLCGESSFSGT